MTACRTDLISGLQPPRQIPHSFCHDGLEESILSSTKPCRLLIADCRLISNASEKAMFEALNECPIRLSFRQHSLLSTTSKSLTLRALDKCPIRFSLSSTLTTLNASGAGSDRYANKYPISMFVECKEPQRQAEAYRTFVARFDRCPFSMALSVGNVDDKLIKHIGHLLAACLGA